MAWQQPGLLRQAETLTGGASLVTKWKEEVERIRQATGLTIALHACPESEWSDRCRTIADEGGEVLFSLTMDNIVWYIEIPAREWPTPARSLLFLLLSRPEAEESEDRVVMQWLQQLHAGETAPLPAVLEQAWQWQEPRVCFLLEHVRPEQPPGDAAVWLPLLSDYFQYKVWLYPFHSMYTLLLVPYTPILQAGAGEESETSLLLDWAYSLHELLSAEALAHIRVCVAGPVSAPRQLGEAVNACLLLSRGLRQFRPQEKAAGVWQHPLERWAASLDAHTLQALRASLPMWGNRQLSQEQAETLDVFFAQQMNISETARHLYLHRNTLLYRLDKLKEQTGLDPRQFSDALLLRLFLLFRQNT